MGRLAGEGWLLLSGSVAFPSLETAVLKIERASRKNFSDAKKRIQNREIEEASYDD